MNKSKLQYCLYLPQDYGQDKSKRWPLLIFLHGAGERGHNLEKLKVHGPPKMVAQGSQFPLILVSPQCPDDDWWNNKIDELIKLIDDIEESFSVDKSRIYLTGISMGGYGTWGLAAVQPDRFAAIAPICGGGDPKDAPALKNLPIWAFHGDKDPIVPLAKSQEMIEAIRAAGGKPKFTVYPGVGHDSWTCTYESDDFWEWLLEQRH